MRVEFTTERQLQGLGLDVVDKNGNELLEELETDERGATLIAKERLMADTFEVEVPLKVYGAPGIEAMSTDCETLEI